MPESLPLIYNPTAGGQGARKVRQAVQALEALGVRAETLPTSGTGSAVSLARRAAEKGIPRLAVAGGDGTVNEVINGIAESGTELAVIPTGTANVLAMELDIPLDVGEACRLAARGDSTSVDLGIAGERYFALMAGIGFDALVIKNLNPVLKKSIRRAAFPVTGLLTFLKKELPLLSVRWGRRHSDGYFVIAANSRYYGGKFGPTPQASMTDGLLDICILKGNSLQEMINFWVAALKKEQLDEPLAQHFRSREIRVTCPSGAPVPVQTDGEVVGELPIRVAIVPGGLKVCAGANPPW